LADVTPLTTEALDRQQGGLRTPFSQAGERTVVTRSGLDPETDKLLASDMPWINGA